MIRIFISFLVLVGTQSCSFFSSEYKAEDLSEFTPFKEIVGKTIQTKSICYITENTESLVKENPYLIQMDTDFIANQGNIYTLPIGTVLHIEKTIQFIKPPGQFAYKNVLGLVFVPELNQEVKFEFVWDSELPDNIGKDRFKYEVYPIAPWLDRPLPLKFDIYDNSSSPYQWAAKSSNFAFNDLLETITLVDHFNQNRNFENSTFDEQRYKEGMNYFVPSSGVITRNQLYLLQLDLIYPEFFDTPTKFIIANDCRIHLSENYISLILTGLFKDDMISSLVNYDLKGDYIDHVVISTSNRLLGSKLTSNLTKLFSDYKLSITDEDLTIKEYQIFESGKIKRIEN